jgi:hypothetical protein
LTKASTDTFTFETVVRAEKRISDKLEIAILKSVAAIQGLGVYQLLDIELDLLSTQTPVRAKAEANRLAKRIVSDFPASKDLTVRPEGTSVFSDMGQLSLDGRSFSTEAEVKLKLTFASAAGGKGIGLNMN